jgi:DNA-binding transcriptional ArsR family regulator
MAFSKAKDFPLVLYQQSLWAKAQSHPARIILLLHLLHNGSASFTTLKQLVPLSPPTVSRHLRFLFKHGFIHGFNKYPTTVYFINHNFCKSFAKKLLLLQKEFSNATLKSTPR